MKRKLECCSRLFYLKKTILFVLKYKQMSELKMADFKDQQTAEEAVKICKFIDFSIVFN